MIKFIILFITVLLNSIIVFSDDALISTDTIKQSLTINKNTIITNSTPNKDVVILPNVIITINAKLTFNCNVNLPFCNIFNVKDSVGLVRFRSNNMKCIYPQWFGATGDHSDTYPISAKNEGMELQNAINCASISGIPLNLGRGIYYTSKSLYVKNAEIYGEQTGGASLPDENYWVGRDVYLTASTNNNYQALFQDGNEIPIYERKSWVYGAIITSDSPITIMIAETSLNLHDFGIIGCTAFNQTGLQVNIYQATVNLRNLNVQSIGGDGIMFTQGLQISTLSNINCSFNKGYGIKIGHQSGIDCPQEYLTFSQCSFLFNYKDGLYIDQFRKRITIKNCDFTGNGWYRVSGAVDRNVPSDPSALYSGIHIVSSPSPQQLNPELLPQHSSDILIEDNFAEDMLSLCKIESKHVLNGITIKNNCMMACPIDNKTSYYTLILGPGTYVRNVEISGNSNYGSTNTPIQLLYSNVGEHLSNVKINDPNDDFNSLSVSGDLKVKKYYQFFDKVIGNNHNETFTVIKNAYSTWNPTDSKGGVTSVWVISGVWNSAMYDYKTESFLLTVTKLPNGNFYGSTLKIGQTSSGCFNGAPVINLNGDVTVDLQPWCLASIQRIDLLGGNLQDINR
jgi:hypothetical protein